MKFHSLRMNHNNNIETQPGSINIKELISKLDIMFEEKLSETFKDILNLPRNKFLDIIISQVKVFLDEQFGDDIYKNEKFIDLFSSSCNNLENKYNKYLEELNNIWIEYDTNKSKVKDNSFFFSKFRKHCLKTENFAMHKCPDGENGYFIISSKKIKIGKTNSPLFQYLICNRCKSVFFTNKFNNYCKSCNENYLSSVLSHNEDPDFLLATWKKPHCDTLVNEKIRCIKCKDNFLYLNLKLHKLQCKNKSCTYNESPYNIESICNICNQSFYSNVIIYNPVEVQQIKDIIKLTLLLKKKAHPTKVSCCKDIDVLTQSFFHKKDCKGLLYFGEYNSNIIIVCEKCKAINFLIRFIWTCPSCGIRFKDKNISNNKDKINQKNLVSNEVINENRRNKIFNYNFDDDESNDKKIRSNKSYGRKSKETLSSLLRRKSGLSVDKSNHINKSNNIRYSTEIENNSISYNIKKIKNEENKENQSYNTNNNLKIITINSIDIDKNNNKRGIKKSISETKSFQNSSRRNSYFKNRMSYIQPIKEEYDTKINNNNSPKEKEIKNNINTNKEQYTIDIRHKSKRIYFKNDNNEKCYSPRTKNIIFNNYFRYINTNSNAINKENKKDDVISSTYLRKQKDENNKNMEKENNQLEYKNRELNKKEDYDYKREIQTKSINDNKIIIQNNIKVNQANIEKKEEKDNKRYYRRNSKINKNDNIIILNNDKSNNMINSERSSKLSRITYRSKIKDNEINKVETPKKLDKNTNLKESNNFEQNKESMRKTFNNNIQFNKYRKFNDKNEDNEEDKKEEEANEKIWTFRRSRFKSKLKEQEEKNLDEKIENNKKEEEDNNNKDNKFNLYLSNNNKFKKRETHNERLTTYDEKNEEEINKEKNEKKEVISRKKLLIEKEKNNINTLTEKKQKESINLINYANLEKRENKRYTKDSLQDAIKTKENTIGNQTKESETFKNTNNKIMNNRNTNKNNNLYRYHDTYDKNNQNKENTNDRNRNTKDVPDIKQNQHTTELWPHYHTKKTRKDYINDKNKKNVENITDEKTETKIINNNFKKENSIVRKSYQAKIRNNTIINNLNMDLDKEEDIPIFDKEIRKDKKKYNQLQYQLKSILVKSCLPKFNIDYYVIKNQIGIGSFGVIFQVYNIKTRCKYALKKIFVPDISTLQKFVKEYELVHQNPHSHILDLIGICIQCIDITNYVLYVLMDLAESDWDKEINYRAKYKKFYSEIELINILKQLVSALYHLQKEKKIAHRDIKPENILIFKNDIYKIGDFGEAKENKVPKQFSTLRGTELYMSPLLYKGLHQNQEDIKHNQFKSDVFSLGYCFIYAASLNLQIIHQIRDINSIISLKKMLLKEFDRRYSDKFLNLILKMIDYNEDKRIDFIDLEKILREEF